MNTITANEMMIQEQDLSAKAKVIFQYLAFRSNKENRCFPALKTIARECSISVSSVQRGLRELLDAGFIRKKHNYRENGSQTSNIYELIEYAEERIQAAKDNALQRIQDLRRRLKYQEEKKPATIAPETSEEKETRSAAVDNLCKGIRYGFKQLKNKYLTRGASQNDYPRTLSD